MSATWARILLVGTAVLASATVCAAQTVANIHIPAEAQSSVSDALDKSPTFRRQYDEISATRSVVVYVYVDDRELDASVRARTTIRKYSSGLILAMVSLPRDSSDRVELLAHEFEHIIEQIERVDLDALARCDAKAAWKRSDGAFETARARRAGIAAAAETGSTQGRSPLRPRSDPAGQERHGGGADGGQNQQKQKP